MLARFSTRHILIFGFTLIVLLSLVSWMVSYQAGYSTAYNDAMSHLNIARLVVDNQNPGLAQLGSVWLPLSHLLTLPLIWNDWAWHSGFAGSIVSMVAYVSSVAGIYLIVKELSKSTLGAVIGALAFALNINMLYLQTTPLTEPLYIALNIFSIYFFIRYIKTNDAKFLIPLGLLGGLQTLTRYDGWFVTVFQAGLLAAHHVIERKSWREIAGRVALYAIPVFFAVSWWFLWNYLVFNDPLYFAFGPYSAHAQQTTIENSTGLITEGSWRYSSLAYTLSMLTNIGVYCTLVSLIGLLFYSFWPQRPFSTKRTGVILIHALLLAPVIFNILALYFGFSILNLPQLNWNPSGEYGSQWFNVRYGLLALPLVAVGLGLLASYRRVFAPLILALIIGQGAILYKEGVITLIDGTQGSSSFAHGDVAQKLQELVNPEDTVLLSTSFFSAVAFQSNLPLKQIVHEGVNDQWAAATEFPYKQVNWIVMANGDIGEPVYTALMRNQNGKFLSVYKLVYAGEHANIYAPKQENEIFITREESGWRLGEKEFALKTVDHLHLAFLSAEEIKYTLSSAKEQGYTAVRVNFAGDGAADGFQPQAGIINPDRMVATDYILDTARELNLRIIPVLSTGLESQSHYLAWIGKDPSQKMNNFYTHPDAINLFKNYVNHIVTQKNGLNGLSYADDPTIIGWELHPHPLPDTAEAAQWQTDLLEYTRSLSPQHLADLSIR